MFRVLAAIGLVLTMATSAFPGQVGAAVPQIDVVPVAKGYEITGRVIGVRQSTLSSTLAIEKKGKSGNVTTRQSREVTLAPGESATIAKTSLSVDPDAVLVVTLDVFDGDVPVGSARVEVGAPEQ